MDATKQSCRGFAKDIPRGRFGSGAAMGLIFFPSGLVKGPNLLHAAAAKNDTTMASDHPFQHLFETLGRVPAAHAESVNRQAVEVLSDILTVPVEKSGRCILLRAPRAGHGKTHLLSRIQHQMGATHEFIPLHSAFGSRIDSSSVIDDTLRRLVRQLPASGGLCVLDLVARRLFASALQPLVGSGEVPCQDREGALAALRARPVETFDFHHPNAVTAHWARENFEVLGQRLALELSQRSGLPVREIGFWVEVLFRFAAAPLENSNRLKILAESVHAGEGDKMERLEALLGLLTLLMRVVLVADDLEGFSADETAALRLAAFLGALRQSVDRLDVILSINQDIWQSAFLPRLSGGLADRLSEVVVELEPLTEAEMAALLDSRVPGLGGRVLERIDIASSGQHARGLIRAAGMAWLKATAMDSASPPVTAPAMAAPAAALLMPPVSVPLSMSAPAEFAPPVAAPPPAVQSALAAFEASEAAAPTSPAELVPVEPGPPAAQFAEPVAPQMTPPPIFNPLPPVATEHEPVIANQEEPAPWPAPHFAAPVTPPLDTPPPSQFTVDSPFSPAKPAMAYQPPVQSPFSMESPAVETPLVGTLIPEVPPLSPEFFPAPISEPTKVWPAAEASTVPAPEPYYPPVQSPFQVAPSEMTSPVEPAFNPPPSMTDSPFEVAAESAQPEPTPVTLPSPPPTASDTDRVDDLLRQFRERYGRGSL